jgi:hypothetical protein
MEFYKIDPCPHDFLTLVSISISRNSFSVSGSDPDRSNFSTDSSGANVMIFKNNFAETFGKNWQFLLKYC